MACALQVKFTCEDLTYIGYAEFLPIQISLKLVR